MANLTFTPDHVVGLNSCCDGWNEVFNFSDILGHSNIDYLIGINCDFRIVEDFVDVIYPGKIWVDLTDFLRRRLTTLGRTTLT